MRNYCAWSSRADRRTKTACLVAPNQGWCVDRQGNGVCVPGQLAGPNDPGRRCAEWWYEGMCLVGARCNEHDPLPPASLERGAYHHPAPYHYRTWPWVDGAWDKSTRLYPLPACGSGLGNVSLVAPPPSSTSQTSRPPSSATHPDESDGFVADKMCEDDPTVNVSWVGGLGPSPGCANPSDSYARHTRTDRRARHRSPPRRPEHHIG